MSPDELIEQLEKSSIFKLQWHITHKCNLRCKHCYLDEYAKEPSLKELYSVFLRYIRHLRKYNAKAIIVISGGEPLVSPFLFNILKWIDDEELIVESQITTNGTMIDKRLAKRLAGVKKLKCIQISIDGNKDTHEIIRGKNTFDKAINAIKILKENKIPVSISFTANKLNYKEIPEVVSICRKVGANYFWSDRVVPIGNEDKQETIKNTLLLSDKEFKEYIDILYNEYLDNSNSCQVQMYRPMQNLRDTTIPKLYRCGAGIQFITITANSELMPCRRIPSIYGNVLEAKEIDEILLNNIEETSEIHNIPEKCQKCRAKNNCRGGSRCLSHAIYGDYNNPDPNCFF